MWFDFIRVSFYLFMYQETFNYYSANYIPFENSVITALKTMIILADRRDFYAATST